MAWFRLNAGGAGGRFPLAALGFLVLGSAMGCAISTVFPHGSPTPQAVRPVSSLELLCRPGDGVRLRKWDYIVLHHTASKNDNASSIDIMHRARGWRNGLGYDFVIGNGGLSGDGEIEVSHRWSEQMDGAHCKADDMNQHAIGICFVGNFEDGPGPSEAQMQAGLELVRYLAQKFSIPPDHILGHRDVDGASTLCPGRNFPIRTFKAAGVARR